MSAIRSVTDDRFEAEVTGSPLPVLVEAWAQWCGPCRQLGPVLESIAEDYAGRLDVVKLNVDENPQTTSRYAIMLVPTLSLFSAGQIVKQVVGARSKTALLREFADFIGTPGGSLLSVRAAARGPVGPAAHCR
jgi:thioredoxin 1